MPNVSIHLVLVAAVLPLAAHAGAPFRTDDPEPVEYRHWEVDGFDTATHVHGSTAGALAAIELNYGALPDTQVHFVTPLAFDRAAGSGARLGYGDTEFGVKYRFLHGDEHGWLPQVAIFPLLDLPTGEQSRGLGTGHGHAFLPRWLGKTLGPWFTSVGGGYWINPGPGNRNYWFAGWLLLRRVADDLAVGGEIFHATANTVGGRDGSGFNLGIVYDFNEHYHLLLSAGRGFQNASATNEFSYYLALQWTF